MARMKSLSVWWQSLPLPWRKWRVVGQVFAGDDVPDRLPYRGVVLVGAPDTTWAVFDCPCRTEHRLLLNLHKSRRPLWRITSRKPLSIFPSIDNITAKRRCHFTIHTGKVTWVSSTNEE